MTMKLISSAPIPTYEALRLLTEQIEARMQEWRAEKAAPHKEPDPLAEKAKTWAFDKPAQAAPVAVGYKAGPARAIPRTQAREIMQMKPAARPPAPFAELAGALVASAKAIERITTEPVGTKAARAQRIKELRAAQTALAALNKAVTDQLEAERNKAFWGG